MRRRLAPLRVEVLLVTSSGYLNGADPSLSSSVSRQRCSSANPAFMGWGNIVRILNSAAVPVTIAMGLTFVILMGSIDLSVEGTMSVAAMVTALLAANDLNGNDLGFSAVALAILSGCLLGLSCGVI